MSTVYTLNGKVLKNSANDKWLAKKEAPVDPLNPLGLPEYTIRVRTSDGNPPVKTGSSGNVSYTSATLVPGTSDVYDVYKSPWQTGPDTYEGRFDGILSYSTNVVEVLGANTTNVTQMNSAFSYCSALVTVPLFDTSSVTTMEGMFNSCSTLTSVPLFDTSSVTNMQGMFANCPELTSIPLFDTHVATNMNFMFNNCYKVESGALALYQQASTQTTPPASHEFTFNNCGSNTTTGAAELAQIPSSWGGTGA